MGDKDSVFIAKGRNDNELILSGSQNVGLPHPANDNVIDQTHL
jgi:hypothetical protein